VNLQNLAFFSLKSEQSTVDKSSSDKTGPVTSNDNELHRDISSYQTAGSNNIGSILKSDDANHDENDDGGGSDQSRGKSNKSAIGGDPISASESGTLKSILPNGNQNKEINDQNATVNLTPPTPSVPLLKGTLSYNDLGRKHYLRGMWNFEFSSQFPSQRFELIRNLKEDDDPTILPKDGEFNGSFSYAYLATSSKGKMRERSRNIRESGVQIVFKKKDGNPDSYDVKGEGTNEFGIFQIFGTAIRSNKDGEPSEFRVELRKQYKTTTDGGIIHPPSKKKSKTKKRKLALTENGVVENDLSAKVEEESGPLPPPSESFPNNVVCLRGKVERDESDANGVVHKIAGMWSSSLELVESDPDNIKGLCNKFEYTHRCTIPTDIFPLSGKYTGSFVLTNDDQTKTCIREQDVYLKFRKNNQGFHNVEGRGSNIFGKYSISGTFSKENIITIFRHFQLRKVKKAPTSVDHSKLSELASSNVVSESEGTTPIKLDDVVIPKDHLKPDGFVKPITPPLHGQYSAVLRGVLRINDDGAHTCSGKWANTREHHNDGSQSFNFHFGLEAHHAVEAAETMKRNLGKDGVSSASNITNDSSSISDIFPVDSPKYKGSFKLKVGTGKSSKSIYDKQIVLKFRACDRDNYNVYGKGLNNSFGMFSLIGNAFSSGGGNGSCHVELYRTYLPTSVSPIPLPLTPLEPNQNSKSSKEHLVRAGKSLPLVRNGKTADHLQEPPQISPFTTFPGKHPPLVRRESSRQTKLPSRLEDNDPKARIARMMQKCESILKILRNKDKAAGSIFAEPVDPEKHGIPEYLEIITNPMDLSTIQTKMDANEIESPEEFACLVRLVFENAVKFNSEPTNPVHLTARSFLALFNQKFRDIERETEIMKREKKLTKEEMKELKRKQKEEKEKKRQEEKKRKRESSIPEDPMQTRMKLLHSAKQETSRIVESLGSLSAEGTNHLDSNVSKSDFNMVVQALQHLQSQINHLQALFLTDSAETKMPCTNPENSKMHDRIKSNKMPQSKSNDSNKPKKKNKNQKSNKKSSKSSSTVQATQPESPSDSHPEDEPLTIEEQRQLTDAINILDQDKLNLVVDIIRESAPFVDGEQDIDLEIDQLDTKTQRKLQRVVNKTSKNTKASITSAKDENAPAESRRVEETEPKPSANDSFFAFGSKCDDSDSDSENDSVEKVGASESKHDLPNDSSNLRSTFEIVDGESVHEEEGEEEEGEEEEGEEEEGEEEGTIAASWGLALDNPETEKNEPGDEDDAWAAARGASATQKALEKERQAREEKVRAEAELAMEKSRAEAAAIGKKRQAELKEKEAEEARLRELKEKEENEQAQKKRNEAIASINSIQPTVDIGDTQRDIMKIYEQNYQDKDPDNGGASPSSDFGF